MAVKAHYLSSYAFSPDFLCRMQAGGVIEGFQMLQSTENHVRHHLHPLRSATLAGDGALINSAFANAAVFSDLPESELTCNTSSCRKRSREWEPTVPLPTPVHQPLGVHISTTAAPITAASAFGINLSNWPSSPAAPSTSGRPAGASAVRSSLIFPELFALFYQENSEVDTLVRLNNERLRLGIEAVQKKYSSALLSAFGHHAANRLREKEAELENASRRNAELEVTARKISAETLIWFNLAKNNEAVASTLRTSLEQAMFQNTVAAEAAAPPAVEGCGDSEEDAESYCFGDAETRIEPSAADELRCKVCLENEVCVLMLPCRHLCLCVTCQDVVDTCPLCHAPKNASLQIFI